MDIGVILLLAHRLPVSRTVASREGGGLPHGVAHGKLALLNILVFILLVEHVPVQVVGEFVPVHDPVVYVLKLALVAVFIAGRVLFRLRQCGKGFLIGRVGYRVIARPEFPCRCGRHALPRGGSGRTERVA